MSDPVSTTYSATLRVNGVNIQRDITVRVGGEEQQLAKGDWKRIQQIVQNTILKKREFQEAIKGTAPLTFKAKLGYRGGLDQSVLRKGLKYQQRSIRDRHLKASAYNMLRQVYPITQGALRRDRLHRPERERRPNNLNLSFGPLRRSHARKPAQKPFGGFLLRDPAGYSSSEGEEGSASKTKIWPMSPSRKRRAKQPKHRKPVPLRSTTSKRAPLPSSPGDDSGRPTGSSTSTLTSFPVLTSEDSESDSETSTHPKEPATPKPMTDDAGLTQLRSVPKTEAPLSDHYVDPACLRSDDEDREPASTEEHSSPSDGLSGSSSGAKFPNCHSNFTPQLASFLKNRAWETRRIDSQSFSDISVDAEGLTSIRDGDGQRVQLDPRYSVWSSVDPRLDGPTFTHKLVLRGT